MVQVHSIVKFPAKSGVARDTVDMSFSFSSDSITRGTSIAALFNTKLSAMTFPLATYLSPWLSRAANAVLIETYDATPPKGITAPMGPPLHLETFTLGNSLNPPAPAEIAVVLSLHADYAAIPEHAPGKRPRSSYRGRLYFGPVTTNVFDSDATTSRSRVASAFRTDASLALTAFQVAEPTWSVWSRSMSAMHPVIGGWIDDDWDVRRSRGPDSLSRTFWP